MIVTKQNFPEILAHLKSKQVLSFDCETTGLRPFSGDKVFSIIIAESETQAYYFNFNYEFELQDLLGPEELLGYRTIEDGIAHKGLAELFEQPNRLWYAHNAMFDCLMMQQSYGIDVNGEIFCTFAQGRVEYNEHMSYSLEASLKRIGGEQKGDMYDYCKEHGLYTKIPLADKKEQYEQLHFEKIPLPIITEYALADARLTFGLGEKLRESIKNKGCEAVSNNEKRLHHAIVNCTTRGLLLDIPYIKRAIEYERERVHAAVKEFEVSSGIKYSNHFKTYEKVFSSDQDRFVYGAKTKTGQINPVFDEDTLKKFSNPLALEVLKARDAQGKLNFYNSYLFFADKRGVLHPNMISGGTNTGRMSSSEPNLQNITSEDLMTCSACGKGHEHIVEKCEKCGSTGFNKPEFLVRRAFIPRPDYCFFNPDYSSQEYRMMLDMAKRLYDHYRARMGLDPVGIEYYELLRKIKEENYDVHQATAETIKRDRFTSKTVNFLKLYGGGAQKLADQLGISLHESHDLSDDYFKAMPYVKFFINTAIRTAETRGNVKNWLGRRNYMARDWSYKAPNQLIQGGCADVMKMAMVQIDQALRGTKSHQLLSVHDEDIVEVHYSDIDKVPQRIIEIMENIYPFDYLPLTASAEWSEISLADKRKGFPTWTHQNLRA